MYTVDHYVSNEGEMIRLWYKCPTRGWMVHYEIAIESGIIKVYHYHRGPAYSPSTVFMSKYNETIKEELKVCLEIYTQTGTLNLNSLTPEDF
jgi:hypothetical protein